MCVLGGRLTSERIRQEHQKSLAYIKYMFDEISGENGEDKNIIIVVVTHHHPTLQTNIDSRYNNPVREGVVFKCVTNGDISFKAISNKFLLKGGD